MKSLQLIVFSLGLTYGGIAAASNTEAAVGGALGGALGSVVGEHLGGSTGATPVPPSCAVLIDATTTPGRGSMTTLGTEGSGAPSL